MKYTFKALDQRHEWEWLESRADCNWCSDTKGIVAYNEEGMIVAAIALDSWSYNAVFIHIAVEDKWVFRHGFAEECFNYIFNDSGRRILLGATPANNEKALKFNRHIGLKPIYSIKDGYADGVDFIVQELRKEDCRYLKHGQEINSRAA